MATLQNIRSKGPLLVIVIGLALFAFIAGDAWKVLQPHQSQDVGEVNGESISAQDFQALVEEYTEVIKFSSGNSALSDEQTNQIKDEVWRTYVNNKLIEKEAKQADFARVSAVFHNRLKINMALGSDVTIKYVTGTERMSLNNSDLSVDSPYNTYRNKGLPPGPICNPSAAAIEAALYPDETFTAQNYLYFCSKDPATGELYFSRTLEEHEAAVKIYAPLWQAYDEKTGAK